MRRLLPAALAVVAGACDMVSLHRPGYVRDLRGAPLPDADVTLWYGADPANVGYARTDSAGRFVLSTFSPLREPIRVQVCRTRFQLGRQEFAGLAQLGDTLRFALAPAPSSLADGTRPRAPC